MMVGDYSEINRPLKLIRKTKEGVYVKMSLVQYQMLERQISMRRADEDYKKWFKDNHECISWRDEYDSWHETWKNKKTGKVVTPPNSFLL